MFFMVVFFTEELVSFLCEGGDDQGKFITVTEIWVMAMSHSEGHNIYR